MGTMDYGVIGAAVAVVGVLLWIHRDLKADIRALNVRIDNIFARRPGSEILDGPTRWEATSNMPPSSKPTDERSPCGGAPTIGWASRTKSPSCVCSGGSPNKRPWRSTGRS